MVLKCEARETKLRMFVKKVYSKMVTKSKKTMTFSTKSEKVLYWKFWGKFTI